MALYYQVAVNIPVKQSVYTYKSEQEFVKGDLVKVPLGKREAMGVILGVTSPEENDKLEGIDIKLIKGLIENSFRLTDQELGLYEWMAVLKQKCNLK